MRSGEEIETRIQREIEEADRLLVVLSKSSLNSEWVELELKAGLKKERASEGRTVLLVRIDEAISKLEVPWARPLRKRHIIDFCTGRKGKLRRKALAELVRNLEKDDRRPGS